MPLTIVEAQEAVAVLLQNGQRGRVLKVLELHQHVGPALVHRRDKLRDEREVLVAAENTFKNNRYILL